MHIHVPAGAVPKDGPSAGVTMATAIASLVRGEPVAADVGMTGEITLTGQVLPIGGLREKSLAAQRAGLKRVIFPRENEPDLDDLPPETRKALEFIPVDTIEEVFAAAFDGKRRTRPQRAQGIERPGGCASRAKLVTSLRPSVDDASADADCVAEQQVLALRTTSSERAQLYSCMPAEHERVLVDVIATVTS